MLGYLACVSDCDVRGINATLTLFSTIDPKYYPVPAIADGYPSWNTELNEQHGLQSDPMPRKSLLDLLADVKQLFPPPKAP